MLPVERCKWQDKPVFVFNHFITIQLSAIETSISQTCRKSIIVLHPHSSGVKSCADITSLFPVSVELFKCITHLAYPQSWEK